jgi:hypothetical protein
VTSAHVEDVPFRLCLEFPGYDTEYLPLGHLPCLPVVRPLAQALVAMTGAHGGIKTPWTAKAYRNAIAQFSRMLDLHSFAGDLSDVTVEHLYAFGAAAARPIERNLRLLLSTVRAAGISPGISPDLVPHLEGTGVALSVPPVALSPYTYGEYTRLALVCRSVIEAADAARTLNAPSFEMILAYRILLGLELGIPADSLSKLELSGIRWQGKRDLHIEWVKPRGDGAQGLTYRLRGPWSGPAILRRWLAASDAMRSRAGSREGLLWICVDAAGDVVPALMSGNAWRPHRLGFLERHRLRDDNGAPLALDFRRLRATWVVRKEKFWHGAITIDPNHSATVEGDNYLTRGADLDAVDGVIEDAQRALALRSEHVALVIAPDDELADQVDGPAAATARSSAPQPSGQEWDMFAAMCRDPFDSPFSSKGEFCVAAVWSCLVCPLALVVPSKLPALLRLHNYLQRQSEVVSQRDWLVAYAPAWVALTTRILPRFSDATIAAARGADDEDLAVPVDPLWAS